MVPNNFHGENVLGLSEVKLLRSSSTNCETPETFRNESSANKPEIINSLAFSKSNQLTNKISPFTIEECKAPD